MQRKEKQSLSDAQDVAANPMENIWVQANAGTGKTSVLVGRLLRILFRSDKTGILCLTYTNAGTGEMRNRILAALREWAMADDIALTELLDNITTGDTVTTADLARAREIFYTYIDNPDMLKIKTIHGFCEEILHRFPIEAGIPPSWSLVSDSAQRILLNDVFTKLVNSSASDAVSAAFSHIVGRISEHSLDELLGILTTQYRQFFNINDIVKYRRYFIDTTRKFLDLDSPIPADTSTELLQNIIESGKTDKKPGKTLTEIITLTEQYIDNAINFEEYKQAYLTEKGTRTKFASGRPYLVDEQERVYSVNQRNLNQQIFDDTIALFDLSVAFAQTYRDLKHERNLLDFDDLILYTARLFSSPDSMGWVLSQLDLSLSHILVDEAQDTAPEQWGILRALAGDFFVGGDVENPRSLFVVGDTKQSIYGFQGADPNAFAASRESISRQIRENLRTIREVPLEQSFRSVAPILKTVDFVFNRISNFANNEHKVFRSEARGLVELYPLVSREDEQTLQDYIQTIAEKIQSLIEIDSVSPGDIMILVQRRHPFAPALVDELKSRNIPVAGSDRIILPRFPAVRDMLNLVRFCIDTDDDYMLACTLKSPLFGLTEDEIYKLCVGRTSTVFERLQTMYPDIYSELIYTIEQSKNLAPYSFFSRILNLCRRQKMIAALGTQIIDPLEEFMTICLVYERTQPGTMRHFLKWFITGATEVKRDMESSDGVRIVTVHGSKGLEAKVVFLIDTTRVPKPDKIISINDCFLWSPHTNNSEYWVNATNVNKDDKMAEYYRLLYVAMTRARDRLYIYGFTKNKSAPADSWYSRLAEIMPNMDNVSIDNDIIKVAN